MFGQLKSKSEKKKSIEDWFCDREPEPIMPKREKKKLEELTYEELIKMVQVEWAKLSIEIFVKTGINLDLDIYESAVEQTYLTDNLVVAGQTKKGNLILVWHQYVFWIGKTGKYWQVRRLHKWERKYGVPNNLEEVKVNE